MSGGMLQGKVALVTGATRSVGKGIAHRLAREGTRVFVNGRNFETVQEVVDGWRQQGLVVEPAVGDIGDPRAIDQMIDRCMEACGRLDILVNNTVIHPERGERGPFLRVSFDGWRDFMDKNLSAMFYLTQKAAALMAKRRTGSIINISSNGAVQAHRQRIAYDALKGALEAFTRAIAVDLAPWGIRANALRLIAVWDPPEPGSPRAALEQRLASMVPMGRIARPSDAAWATVFLASDESAFITGQCFNIDGGQLEQSRPPALELEPVATPDDTDP